MGAINKQQRMSNILLAGNLYKAHKIDKGIKKVAELQRTAMIHNVQMHQQSMALREEMIAKQDKGNKIAEKQLNFQLTQAQEIKKTKLLKNTFFEISEEVEDILKEKKITNIEKYFRYGSIKATLEKNGIGIEITDELSEKKLIRNTIKKIENEISTSEKKFNTNDKRDLEEIFQTLEVDEENEIKKLNSTEVAQLEEITKKLRLWFSKAQKLPDGHGLLLIMPSKRVKTFDEHSADTKLFSMIAENVKLIKKGKKLILPNHLLEKSTSKKIRESVGLESLNNIMNSKVLEIWYNRHFKKFFTKMNSKDISYFDTELDRALDDIEEGDTKSLFGKVKTLKEKLRGGVFDKWRSDAFDKMPLEKILYSAFNEPFSKSDFDNAAKDGYNKNKDKIESLKKDIETEKTKLQKIFKKHPFVKTIVSNR